MDKILICNITDAELTYPSRAVPAGNFLKDETYPNKLYITGKGIYPRVQFILDIDKIFCFRDYMSNFRQMAPQWLQEKISNFYNMNISYIILKHMIWRFR